MAKFSARYRDIFWGGRVRVEFQQVVWNVAMKYGCRSKTCYSGSMLSSSQSDTLRLLDGKVTESRGCFGSGGGMFVVGEKALQFILYEIGEKPGQIFLKAPKIFSHKELKAEAVSQHTS